MCRQQDKEKGTGRVSEPCLSSLIWLNCWLGRAKRARNGRKGPKCHNEQLDFSLGVDGEPEGDFEEE